MKHLIILLLLFTFSTLDAKKSEWIETKSNLPESGVCVHTKIDDGKGLRNEQILIYVGSVYISPDEKIPVWVTEDLKSIIYYQPTHWKACKNAKRYVTLIREIKGSVQVSII